MNDETALPWHRRRNFTSTLMDGTLLVDPGPHIFRFAAEHGMPDLFDNVTDVLVTHSHGDHFSPTVVKTLWEKKPRRLIGGFGCMQCLTEYDPLFAAKVDFTELKPFEGTAAAGLTSSLCPPTTAPPCRAKSRSTTFCKRAENRFTTGWTAHGCCGKVGTPSANGRTLTP